MWLLKLLLTRYGVNNILHRQQAKLICCSKKDRMKKKQTDPKESAEMIKQQHRAIVSGYAGNVFLPKWLQLDRSNSHVLAGEREPGPAASICEDAVCEDSRTATSVVKDRE